MRFISLALLLFSAGSVALAASPAAREEQAHAIKARRDAVPQPGDAHLLFPSLSEYHDESSQADADDDAPRLMRLMRRAKSKSRKPKIPKSRNNDNSTANETESAASALLLGRQHGFGQLLGYGATTVLFSLFIVVFQNIAL